MAPDGLLSAVFGADEKKPLFVPARQSRLNASLAIPSMIVTTTNELAGYRVVRHLGIVRGLSVRSRSVVGNIGAAIQILFGGNIAIYTRLAEDARNEAYGLLIQHAEEAGANAILAMRYDANEMASAVTEVLAYGTAVVVEKLDAPAR